MSDDPVAGAVGAARDWQVDDLDLAGYLRRVGCAVPGTRTPDAALLREVHRGHSRAIPFENLDIVLGRGVRLSIGALQDKLVRRRRGGYCHEQNLLLAAALERLGFEVTRLSARMQVGSAGRQPRTHIALRVSGADGVFLADVGLGIDGLVDPVPWRQGRRTDPDGWVHELRGIPEGWELRLCHRDQPPRPLYRVTEEPAMPIDFEVATYWTSTHPDSPFVRHPMVHMRGEPVRCALSGDSLLRRSLAHEEVSVVAPTRYGQTLEESFGLSLSAPELAALASRGS